MPETVPFQSTGTTKDVTDESSTEMGRLPLGSRRGCRATLTDPPAEVLRLGLDDHGGTGNVLALGHRHRRRSEVTREAREKLSVWIVMTAVSVLVCLALWSALG